MKRLQQSTPSPARSGTSKLSDEQRHRERSIWNGWFLRSPFEYNLDSRRFVGLLELKATAVFAKGDLQGGETNDRIAKNIYIYTNLQIHLFT